MLAKIGRDLAAVDTPSPEIAIEAVAVEFTDDINKKHRPALERPAQYLDHHRQSVARSDHLQHHRSVAAKTSSSRSRPLSSPAKPVSAPAPRMAVVNGRQASIFIGSQQFILTQFQQLRSNPDPHPAGRCRRQAGRSPPLTGGNGEITTTIAPEVSNITEQDAATGLPVLSTRKRLHGPSVSADGETVVIGGLTLDQQQSSHQKIPLLGDLPFLGKLFRSETANSVRTELVVFVTPPHRYRRQRGQCRNHNPGRRHPPPTRRRFGTPNVSTQVAPAVGVNQLPGLPSFPLPQFLPLLPITHPPPPTPWVPRPLSQAKEGESGTVGVRLWCSLATSGKETRVVVLDTPSFACERGRVPTEWGGGGE